VGFVFLHYLSHLVSPSIKSSITPMRGRFNFFLRRTPSSPGA
jgi:hypothetical protein